MQNTDKELKLYYSISEVAGMFDVNESLLRFGRKSFRNSGPRRGGVAYASTVRKILRR